MSPRFRLAVLGASLALAPLGHAQLKPPAAVPAPAAPAPAAPPAAAPAGNPAMENAGRLAAHAWLALLDRQDWGTAWETSAGMFRQAVPLDTWMDNVPKAREPFGRLVERQAAETVYRTTLPGKPEGHYVSVLFVSKFDKQRVQEIVTAVREADGSWRVTGYSPRPLD